MNWKIDPDIRKAHTLPGSFYSDQQVYEALIENAFVPSWQWLGDSDLIAEKGDCYPFELLPGSLNEPLLLLKDYEDNLRFLSNVCTHRGKILVEKPCRQRFITCGYHGRCFNLDGSFRSMSEFKQTENFPSENDHLTKLELKNIGVFLFGSLAPAYNFDRIFKPILERMFWFPFDQLKFEPEQSQDYTINTHWALYCDNYLEGFHVPFVHPGLGANLDYENYDTELFEFCNLQLGAADPNAAAFQLPTDSIDYGKRIHAYYWWIFPNLMLNVYTWGISVNIVEPLGIDKTKVRFYSYLLPGLASDFSKDMLHQTEMEDEAIVQSVQKGLKSRFYKHGRFSPTKEKGVHHFHRLLASVSNKKT